MQYRNLGQSGLRVSAVGLGCVNFGTTLDVAASAAVVHAALDNGITYFDTAAAYARGDSERFLGAALGGRRCNAVIATKFGGLGDPDMGPAAGSKGGRAYILRAVDAALQRLKTDYIDVFMLHRPDPETPLEETLMALDDLIRFGKVRYSGCSGFAAWQLADAAHVARQSGLHCFSGAMIEWSLLQRDAEKEFVPAARRFGCGILPFFPLASGLLTGKIQADGVAPAGSRLSGWAAKFVTPSRLAHVERLRVWATAHQRSLTDVALAWLAGQEGVGSVIAGASTPEQVAINAGAASWQATAAQVAEIGAL